MIASFRKCSPDWNHPNWFSKRRRRGVLIETQTRNSPAPSGRSILHPSPEDFDFATSLSPALPKEMAFIFLALMKNPRLDWPHGHPINRKRALAAPSPQGRG